MFRIKNWKLELDIFCYLEEDINFQHSHDYVAVMINEISHVHVLHPLNLNIRPWADDKFSEVTYLYTVFLINGAIAKVFKTLLI